MVGWLCCLGPMVRQCIMGECSVEPSFSHHGEREGREMGKAGKGAMFPILPSKCIPNDLVFFHKVLYLKGSTIA